MSVLEAPRIMFRGRIGWDPIVTNNDPAQYDENASEAVFRAGEGVKAFRDAAIASTAQASNWNPHGTHRSVFYETAIVGVDVGAGVVQDDPFVGCPVNFTGMLVDLEPYGALTSQLFFDVMTFGIDGGCQIVGRRTSRFTARYINFRRNLGYRYIAGGASVVWQTSFAKADGLRIEAHDSPALQALAEALTADDVVGLTVRWNAYRTLYYNSRQPANNSQLARQLAQKLTTGGFQPNPARSEVVGVVGLWRRGEPPHEPGDRALVPPATAKDGLGSASARLTSDTLTLDLANSVPETNVDLVKQDLGSLTVVAVAADGKTVVASLGTFSYGEYDREAYDKAAGIVTLRVDAEIANLASVADLQLRAADGTVLLSEVALRAVPMEPNVYLDEGESHVTRVQALDRGVPAGSGIGVGLAVADASLGASNVQRTGSDGIAEFALKATKGQVEAYLLVAGAETLPPANGINPQTTTYMYVRTLPADTDVAGLPPTWANVHARVLRSWQAMAPCMDNWLSLGDEAQVKAYGGLIKRLTNKASLETLRFMPVTRDMTAGQRTLLYKFLDGSDSQSEGQSTAPDDQRSAAGARKLSRAMRGN